MADGDGRLRLARGHAGEAARARPQLRAERHDGMTQERRIVFLEALAATCNVSAAARAIGVRPNACYVLRDKDAGFRGAWEDALARGYEKLELAMLDRAINGIRKPIIRGDREIGALIEFNDSVGLRLLQAHRETAQRARERHYGGRTPEEVFGEIKQRLTAIRSRETRALGSE